MYEYYLNCTRFEEQNEKDKEPTHTGITMSPVIQNVLRNIKYIFIKIKNIKVY